MGTNASATGLDGVTSTGLNLSPETLMKLSGIGQQVYKVVLLKGGRLIGRVPPCVPWVSA